MKKLVGIFAILAVFATGIFLFETDPSTKFTFIDTTQNQDTESGSNEITKLFNTLEQETQITFADPIDENFQWKAAFGGAPYEAVGKSIKTGQTLITKADKINLFFSTQGFAPEQSNNSKEVTYSQAGLIKDNLVCLIVKKINIDTAEVFLDEIIIRCGYIEK